MSLSTPESNTRNRSNSALDSELSEHERKRPRLSASKGTTGVHSPKIEVGTPDENLNFQQMQSKEGTTIPRAALPPTSETNPILTSPTSKVTINTRPLSSQSMAYTDTTYGHADDDQVHATSLDPQASPNDVTTPATPPQDTITQVGNNAHQPISVSSSPSKLSEPEILVAEPEDFDSDPRRTRWISHIGGKGSRFGTGSAPLRLLSGFPLFRDLGTGDIRPAIQKLARIFADARDDDGELFQKVKNWMVNFVTNCDVFTDEICNLNRELWSRLPSLVDSLLKREQRAPRAARSQDLTDFFLAYGRITKLIVAYSTGKLELVSHDQDILTLDSSIVELASAYLIPLAWTINPSMPFFVALQYHHNVDLQTFINPLADELIDPEGVNIMHGVSRFTSALGSMLPKRPDWHKPLAQVANFLMFFANLLAGSSECDNVPDPHQLLQRESLLRGAEEIALQIEAVLQNAIKKQHPWLTIETGSALISKLNNTMVILSAQVPRVGQSIVISSGVVFEARDIMDLSEIMQYAWKFMTLLKFIKYGKMELRVYGVDTISADLVSIFHSHIEGKDLDIHGDALVNYAVRFIRANQMIEYIIGVDSHPQLIHKSPNIVGFLAVAGKYTDSDTDTLWQVIQENEDSRTAVEVLLLLQSCCNSLAPDRVDHICQKLTDFPLFKYDDRMLEFTKTLFHYTHLRAQHHPRLEEKYSSNARNLCIRLLRDTNTPQNCASEHARHIHEAMLSNLRIILQSFFGLHRRLTVDSNEETQLLHEIRNEIQLHSDAACGLIYVVNLILEVVAPSDEAARHVIEVCDLPRGIVEDLVKLSHHVSQASVSTFATMIQYESRLDCLCILLKYAPHEFDISMMRDLWENLLACESIPVSIRTVAWNQLTNFMKMYQRQNHALDLILNDFLPQLTSSNFNKAVLDFATEAALYEARNMPGVDSKRTDVVTVPGIDLVWKMMLECPPGSVENESTNFIIDQYLRGPFVKKCSRASIHATHLALIDRVVDLVLGSAARLKSFAADDVDSSNNEILPMIATQAEIGTEKLRFDRSLQFLRRFTEASRGRAAYSPASPQNQESLPTFLGRKGDSREITIEIINNKYINCTQRRMTIGATNTGDELWQYLSEITGFSQFTAIHDGQKILLRDVHQTLENLKLTSGKIMITKTHGSQEQVPPSNLRATSPMDEKIMLHFEDLYELLESDDQLAKEVFSFLSMSSVRETVSEAIRQMSTTVTDLLSSAKPYKLLFCIQALRNCIEVESFSSDPNVNLLTYAIHATVAALPRLETINSSKELAMLIAHELVDTLLLALRTKVPGEVSERYIVDASSFVDQILRILHDCQHSDGIPATHLSAAITVKTPFEVLVEASLHDTRLWKVLDENDEFEKVIRHVFLQDKRSAVRQAILNVVLSLTGPSGKLSLKVNDPRGPRSRYTPEALDSCLCHIWQVQLRLMSEALEQDNLCQEFFDAALLVLRKVGMSFEIADLENLFHSLKEALLGHQHTEAGWFTESANNIHMFQNESQPLADAIISGLIRLTQENVKILRSKKVLPDSHKFVKEIVTKFLFPPLSEPGKGGEYGHIPVLDPSVRESFYDLVLLLCQKPGDSQALISDLSNDLTPRGFFEPHISHDKLALRTETGYAGLRNLSNTCYLNSLFSQLFMNLQFRELLFNITVVDGSKQKLLMELSKVFAHMQNSHEKSVDPSAAVEAIITYDREQIDVTIQMDVDEFFNLLFDRLEGQIIEPATKNMFKSLYGGQTMHQIKSKECEHISERVEPFSAVQVEIKGKSCLEDSLKAYVEGEVLQGENKYSCTACGRHVDAVKRACLKDVPDNLIFNLKRFDYDIMTGVRCKLNDQFQFPDSLDITPYTFEHLSSPEADIPSDLFELTGIVVHSGTADSGHYYSYIRQRPSAKEKNFSWVQFNDHDVTPFDPLCIQDNCFGGVDTSCYNMAKFYNAYMLFYQRKSSIEVAQTQYMNNQTVNPARLTLPPDTAEHISQLNEIFLRSYCVQDPSHARFVRQILEKVSNNSSGGCTEDHRVETNAKRLALDYMSEVSARWKSLPDVETTANLIVSKVRVCSRCAKEVVVWFLKEETLLDMAVRSPFPTTRKLFARMLFEGLLAMRRANENQSNQTQFSRYMGYIDQCLAILSRDWEYVIRNGRVWPEYFNLLNEIWNLGNEEAYRVLDAGFLEMCTELILLHVENGREFKCGTELKQRYQHFLFARAKNRPFYYGLVINFFWNMFSSIDIHNRAQTNQRPYNEEENKFGLSLAEREVLGFDRLPYRLEWLRRIIGGRHNPTVDDKIVASMASDRVLAGTVSACVSEGLNARSMLVAVQFLRSTITFCRYCPSVNQITDLLTSTFDEFHNIELDYGLEYLGFVQELLTISNTAAGCGSGAFRQFVLDQIHQWAPVCLIAHNESHFDIRTTAMSLVEELLFRPLNEARATNVRLFRTYQEYTRRLAIGVIRFVREQFLEDVSKEISIHPGQATQLVQVTNTCLGILLMDNAIQEERVAELQKVMQQFRIRVDQMAETISSGDWQESSEMEAVSEAGLEENVSP